MAALDTRVLFESRVLFLTGKGGVGKTTLAASIGRLAASQGRNTLVVEVDNQHPSLPVIFGTRADYVPSRVEKNLSITNIAWAEALEDWVESIVSMRRLVRLIMKNKVVSLFLQVTPGARDLVMLWRIVQLSKLYDLVVVDLPASGNAVAMLAVPHTAERLFPAGPIRRCADEILALYAQASTRLALVAIPEEMVVNETLETMAKIRRDARSLDVGMLLLNRASPPTLTEGERTLLGQLEAGGNSEVAREVLGAGRWEENLEAATAEALQRFGTAGPPLLALPALPRSEGVKRVVQQTTGALARSASGHISFRGAAT